MADRRFRNRAWTKDAQGFWVAQAEFLKAAKMPSKHVGGIRL